jgi:hypothetical protein
VLAKKIIKTDVKYMPKLLSRADKNALACQSYALAVNQLDVDISEQMLNEAYAENFQSHSLIGQDRAKNALSFRCSRL